MLLYLLTCGFFLLAVVLRITDYRQRRTIKTQAEYIQMLKRTRVQQQTDLTDYAETINEYGQEIHQLKTHLQAMTEYLQSKGVSPPVLVRRTKGPVYYRDSPDVEHVIHEEP